MKCNFSLEDIIKYTENQLSDDDRKMISEHLNSCEKCRRYYGVLKFTDGYAKESIPVSDRIRKNVMEAIDVDRYSKDKKRFFISRAMPYMKPILASAAGIVLIAVVALNYNNLKGNINYGGNVGSQVTSPVSDPQNTNLIATNQPVERKTLTLYYGNSNADGVVAEKREVEFDKDKQIERVVFEELQKKPKTQDLYATIPEGTKLLSVTTEGGICTLNLSKEFVDNSPGGSAGELMTLYSIINSLTELPGIDKVQFLIEGQKQEAYIHAVFNEPFERNEEIIKTQTSDSSSDSDNTKSEVEAKSRIVVSALKEKDMQKLSSMIHPTKGILFSPYSHIELESDKVFTKEQILDALNSEELYTWGNYDGIGDPIKLTFAQYFDKFVYDKDFENAEKVSYNEIQQQGNTLVNIKEVYPQANFVDYYFSGFNTEYEGMDWESLRLVFEQYNGQWYLVCIAHGQWTI
jgi:hypothetical protein